MKNHCELRSNVVGDIHCRLTICSHGAQTPSVLGCPLGVPVSTTLLVVCAASGRLPRTQYSLFCGLLVGSATASLWLARKETCTIGKNDVPDILRLPLSRRTHNMMWSQGLRTPCGHITATTIVDTHVIRVVQYGSTCVALGCYGGKFCYIDIEGSTRLPSFGLFYVPFNNLEDLVNHGLFAEAKLRKAYCKCATEGCEVCHFWLHMLSFSQPTTVPTVVGTVLHHGHGSQLRANGE